MRTKTTRITCMFVVFLACWCPPLKQSLHAQDKSDEIKTLLKERRDLLNKVVKQLSEHYRLGIVPFEVVAKAQYEALRAELDLAENPEQRIAILRKMKDSAEISVKVAKANVEGGIRNGYEVLQANAFLIEMRVELLKEEQKRKRP